MHAMTTFLYAESNLSIEIEEEVYPQESYRKLERNKELRNFMAGEGMLFKMGSSQSDKNV